MPLPAEARQRRAPGHDEWDDDEPLGERIVDYQWPGQRRRAGLFVQTPIFARGHSDEVGARGFRVVFDDANLFGALSVGMPNDHMRALVVSLDENGTAQRQRNDPESWVEWLFERFGVREQLADLVQMPQALMRLVQVGRLDIATRRASACGSCTHLARP